MQERQYFLLSAGALVFIVIIIGCATDQKTKPAKVPQWLQEMPKDDKYFYAVGVSGQTRRIKDAWDQAILRARAELGKTIVTHVTSHDLIISTNKGYYARQLIEALSDTELNFTEVIARWYDQMGSYGPANHYYVLVRLEKKRAETILQGLK